MGQYRCQTANVSFVNKNLLPLFNRTHAQKDIRCLYCGNQFDVDAVSDSFYIFCLFV